MSRRVLKLKVIKRDGAREEYFHTKVLGTIIKAFDATGRPDITAAEQFAEAITFYLHNNDGRRNIDSGEIFSIIEAVLADTGCLQEAIALSEHYFQRKLSRGRVEVVHGKETDLTDAGIFSEGVKKQVRSRWDKSRIVEDLVSGQWMDRYSARAVASMVEERVFSMDLTVVPSGLIEQLVLNAAATVLKARQQLQTV